MINIMDCSKCRYKRGEFWVSLSGYKESELCSLCEHYKSLHWAPAKRLPLEELILKIKRINDGNR